jgi:hypothetical protein
VNEPAVYAADTETLLRVVRRFPDAAGTMLLVGHNPGMEDLAALLAGEGSAIGLLPTAGLVHLELEADRWADVRPAKPASGAFILPRPPISLLYLVSRVPFRRGLLNPARFAKKRGISPLDIDYLHSIVLHWA